MEIKWHGLTCFSIKGDNARVVIDPFDRKHTGVKMPKLEADVIMAYDRADPAFAVGEVDGTPNVFDWPGEYEAKGVHVNAIPAYDHPRAKEDIAEEGVKGKKEQSNVLIYSFEVDGVKICHLSTIGHKLTNDIMEQIGEVDILLIPVGGGDIALNSEKAREVVEQIEPRVVIPMYYDIPGLSFSLKPVDIFLKETGATDVKREKSFKVKKRSDLPVDKTDFVVLEPSLG
ncbi:MAG: MBL fold metallo-hydrolase [Patescibacteria group bacterium]